nr:sushi domain-containing protein 6 [Salvelinus alpinus]
MTYSLFNGVLKHVQFEICPSSAPAVSQQCPASVPQQCPAVSQAVSQQCPAVSQQCASSVQQCASSVRSVQQWSQQFQQCASSVPSSVPAVSQAVCQQCSQQCPSSVPQQCASSGPSSVPSSVPASVPAVCQQCPSSVPAVSQQCPSSVASSVPAVCQQCPSSVPAVSQQVPAVPLTPSQTADRCPRPVAVEHGELVNQTEANRGSSPPVCPPPTEPENGGYRCHPSPCHRLTQKTVIEYFCDEGYALKGDYKFLTCQNGEWDVPMQITCRLSPDKEPRSPLAMPALSIVASTASSVALLLLLVVLFVLLQPKLKSFHHSRREQGVSGQPPSIVVEGVQVALPSYEEAVYGSGGGASLPPPPESRVQIVLSEGPRGAEGGAEGLSPSSRSQSHHHRDRERDTELCLPSSSSSFPSSCRHAETVLVHQAPSASSSSSWVTAHGGSALARRRDSESSDQHSLLSVTSVDDFSDDIPLLKET